MHIRFSASNLIIVISYDNTIQDYQAFVLDITTGSSTLKNSKESNFKDIEDIELWNSHPDQILIMKSKEIYSYNFTTGEIEHLIGGGEDSSFSLASIMQDETGRYLYDLGNTTLNVLDLVDKTVETLELPLPEGFNFFGATYCETMFDSKRQKIIANIEKGMFGDQGFVVINLDDFSLDYVDGAPTFYNLTWLFLEDENKFFFTSEPYLYMADLESGDVLK